jgi:3-oxoacyl-[acyl-carrier protein] reductase
MDLSSLPKFPGLAGRIALVTGASRGIGRAIAEALARQDATVIGTATSEAGAAEITAWIGALSPNSRGAVVDVGSDTSVDALFAALAQREGAPEVVVNNAGITRDNLLMRMKPEEWNDVVSTNLSSCIASARRACAA